MNLMLGNAEDDERHHCGYKRRRKRVKDKTSQRDGKF